MLLMVRANNQLDEAVVEDTNKKILLESSNKEIN